MDEKETYCHRFGLECVPVVLEDIKIGRRPPLPVGAAKQTVLDSNQELNEWEESGDVVLLFLSPSSPCVNLEVEVALAGKPDDHC